MTTTGCAKYSTILEQSNFEVIIIEEAGEVLESHVLSLLTKNTKHLILIGDLGNSSKQLARNHKILSIIKNICH